MTDYRPRLFKQQPFESKEGFLHLAFLFNCYLRWLHVFPTATLSLPRTSSPGNFCGTIHTSTTNKIWLQVHNNTDFQKKHVSFLSASSKKQQSSKGIRVNMQRSLVIW